MSQIITRYCPPTIYDEAQYATIWRIINDDQKIDYYIQVNKENPPRWIKMGEFFEKAFTKSIDSIEFMNNCLRLFHDHEDQPILSINKILKDL